MFLVSAAEDGVRSELMLLSCEELDYVGKYLSSEGSHGCGVAVHLVDHSPEDTYHGVKHVIPLSFGLKLLYLLGANSSGTSSLGTSVHSLHVALRVDLTCSRCSKLD